MTSTTTVNIPLDKVVVVEVYLECPIGEFAGSCLFTHGEVIEVFYLDALEPNEQGQISLAFSAETLAGEPDTVEISLINADGVYIQGVAVAVE